MVGAPSSNRCGVCKQRRVKCDEAWPTCGPCQKRGRECPGPPERTVRYAHDYAFGKKQQQNQMLKVIQVQPATRGHKHGVDSQTNQRSKLIPVRVGWKQGVVSFPRALPWSSADILAHRLHAFLQWDEHEWGTKAPIRGVWIRQLPQRFGSSPALDHAVACLVSSHEAVARGDSSDKWLDFKQYGKALRSLQRAIDAPNEQLSTNTVAAVALMWRIEGILSSIDGKDHNQRLHARALLQMFKIKGPRVLADSLETFLVLECHVAASQDSLNHDIPQHCFFDSDQWDSAFQDLSVRRNNDAEPASLYGRLIREWVKYPGLIRDLMLFRRSKDTAPVTAEAIFNRVVGVARRLELIWHGIEKFLHDPKVFQTIPSPTGDPLVPIVFVFKNNEIANLVGYFVFTTILIHQMVLHLSSTLSTSTPNSATKSPPGLANDLPNTTSTWTTDELNTLFSRHPILPLPLPPYFVNMLRARTLQLAHIIWMMYDQVRKWKPVGCLFYIIPLKVTFPWSPSDKMRAWILAAAEDLEEFLPSKTGWEPEKVILHCQFLSGERLDHNTYKTMKIGQQWGFGGIGEEGFVRI